MTDEKIKQAYNALETLRTNAASFNASVLDECDILQDFIKDIVEELDDADSLLKMEWAVHKNTQNDLRETESMFRETRKELDEANKRIDDLSIGDTDTLFGELKTKALCNIHSNLNLQEIEQIESIAKTICQHAGRVFLSY